MCFGECELGRAILMAVIEGSMTKSGSGGGDAGSSLLSKFLTSPTPFFPALEAAQEGTRFCFAVCTVKGFEHHFLATVTHRLP